MFKILLLLLIFLLNLNAYESEDRLKVVIVGKVAKYIVCKSNRSEHFIITVLKNPYSTLFDDIYKDKKIKSRPVKIVYIQSIEELESTNILYIPNLPYNEVSTILEKTSGKEILTISESRGFAQRGGVIQLYFLSQKLKLKINTSSAAKQKIKIKPTLLRIADVVQGDKE